MKKILVCLIVLLTELTNINASKESTLDAKTNNRPTSLPTRPFKKNFYPKTNTQESKKLEKFLKEKYGPFEKEEKEEDKN